MQLRSGVQIHEFTDSSGILFYNALTEESIIVAVGHCLFEDVIKVDGTKAVILNEVSSDVMERLISKRFIRK